MCTCISCNLPLPFKTDPRTKCINASEDRHRFFVSIEAALASAIASLADSNKIGDI